MEQEERAAICPECGQQITEKDKECGNVVSDGKEVRHKTCRLIRK